MSAETAAKKTFKVFKKIIGIIFLIISLIISVICYIIYQMVKKVKYLLDYGTNRIMYYGLIALGTFLFLLSIYLIFSE